MRRFWLYAAALAGTACGRIGFESRPTDASTGTDAALDSYGQVVMQDRPAAFWRFDEQDHRVALDSAGSNLGMFVGAVGRAPGVTGQAAVFDGTTTRLQLGDVFPFGGSAPYTLELWTLPAIVDDNVRFLIARATPGVTPDGYDLYFAKSFTLTSRTQGGNSDGFAGGPGLIADRWMHVVATFDGNRTAMHLDGTLIENAVSLVLLEAGPGSLTIGDGGETQFYKYQGLLDEIAIYPTALSVDRIAAHFTAGR